MLLKNEIPSFKLCFPIIPLFIRTILRNKKSKLSVYDVFILNLKYKQNYKDKWKSSLDLDIDDNDWNLINMNVTKITQDTTV